MRPCRRRFPHPSEPALPVFITWRLHESLPKTNFGPVVIDASTLGDELARSLEESHIGVHHLSQKAIADMVAETILDHANRLGNYTLHAFVIMPNHVHMLLTPAVALSTLLDALRAATTERAQSLLELEGQPFWREDSYVCTVQYAWEVEKLRSYIDCDPVRAGLVQAAGDYRWSSVGWPNGGAQADLTVVPEAGDVRASCATPCGGKDVLAIAG